MRGETMNEPIQEKAPKPAGLLPKHVQSWLILGLAVLMVVIMWLTGGKKPQTAAKTSTATLQTPPVEVNETKIAELQNRIQELQREQLAAQSALAQQSRLLGGIPTDQQQTQSGSTTNGAAGEHAEDPIKAERKKREYLSLFASNIALTYRKNPTGAQPAISETSLQVPESPNTNPFATPGETALLAQLLKDPQLAAASQQVSVAQANPSTATQTSAPSAKLAEGNRKTKEVNNPAAAPPNSSLNAAAGKTHILFEGTVLESVLINRLDGQFSGPIDCLLTNDIYSHDRQHLLIPSGTKILGETKPVEAFGQTRLAVAFHRLIMPDGYSVSLDQFKGLNQIGDTGLRDQVNNHYLRIFGASLAIGALGAVAEAGTGGILNQSGTDRIREGFGQSMAQSSERILDRFLNILPTVTIREGHRVKVYLSGDLALPDYNNHKMPSDL